jgi:hypothetical protein
MATKRSSTSKKKATAKKAAKKAVTLPRQTACVRACVKEFIACIKAGGNKRECRNQLTQCIEDCLL